MTARYLADTSVLVRMPKPVIATIVGPLLLAGVVAISAVVRLELLRFTLSPADHRRAAANLAGVFTVPTTEGACHARALRS